MNTTRISWRGLLAQNCLVLCSNVLYKPYVRECFHTKKNQNTGRFLGHFTILSIPSKQLIYKSSKIHLCLLLILATGFRTGGRLPLYSNSGSRCPDRQEGPAHQTTRPLRWSFHQGGSVEKQEVQPSLISLFAKQAECTFDFSNMLHTEHSDEDISMKVSRGWVSSTLWSTAENLIFVMVRNKSRWFIIWSFQKTHQFISI